MKRHRHTEAQVIIILKAPLARRVGSRAGSAEWRDRVEPLSLEGQVRRYENIRGQAAAGTGDRECPPEEAAGGKRSR